MKVSELKEALDELEVPYEPKALKAELEALLEEHTATEEEHVEDAHEPEEVLEEEIEEIVEEELADLEEPDEEYEDVYAGKVLGGKKVVINRTEPHHLNGRDYLRLHLGDNTTMLLSEEDLEKQLVE